MSAVVGGAKLEAYLKGMAKKLAKPGTLRVGFLEGSTYPNGTQVAMVAAIQEYGAPRARIPPRPFFRNMIAAKQAEWPGAIAGLLKDHDPAAALSIAGEAIAGQLRESILRTNAPPLSPVTLMLRKMRIENPGIVITGRTVGIAAARVAAGESTAGVPTKPLVWTSHLINSVDYEVVTK
jgi:hypothetical protein